MDNFTHSLFGVVLAEGAYQLARRKKNSSPAPTRLPFYFCSILANNLPDLDLLMHFYDASPLAYLIHHRGYTHTLLWAIPQAVLVYLLTPRKGHHRLLLAALSMLGLCTHMFLDYQNSYGIHMFSPFNQNWFYGDTLFIIEPFLWLPIFALGVRSWPSLFINGALFLLFFAVQGFGYYMGLTTLTSFSFLLAWFGLIYVILYKLNELQRPAFILIVLLAVIGAFKFHRGQVAENIQQELHRQNIAGLIDLVLSPLPSHPMCWNFFAVSLNGDAYRVDIGSHGVDCPTWSRGISLELPASPLSPTREITWLGTYNDSAKTLTENYESDCRVKAWFQFVRVPSRNGSVLSDLRFGGGRNFSTLDLKSNSACPKLPTAWIPPRQDLLEASRKP